MEFRDKHAIYLQLADQVCEAILRGQWREGERIPSIREFAVSVEVNPNTVARTFAHLQGLGIVSAERGAGYCVASGAPDAIRRMKRENFLARDLPDLFKTMHLLGLNWDDLRQEYDRSGGASAAAADEIGKKE